MTRRTFVKSSLSMTALSMMPFRFPFNTAMASGPEGAPIQPVPLASSREFNGDEVVRSHRILWDIANYVQQQGGLPAPTEEFASVVIGGGIAGLTAAYALRGDGVLLLEQDRSFGGNSKGEVMGGSAYGIGAAYVLVPPAGSPIANFLGELGLMNGRRDGAEDSTVFFQGRFAKGFWQATTDPAARASFEQVFQVLKTMNARLIAATGDEPWILALDRMAFEQWLGATFGRVHPHLHEYFQLYAWSSFATSLDELSAYQMLEFIAAETGPLMAFPGGNGAISQALYQRLHASIGPQRMRNGCLVIDVRLDGESVLVTYVQPDGKLKTVRTKAVVFAAPKFIARHVLRNLTPVQDKAMASIKYRGYLVGNIVLDRAVAAPCYELYHLAGEVPPSPDPNHQSPRPFTDVVFGSWAQGDRVDRSVLTVYKGFAFDGDRAYLFNPMAHDKFRNKFVEGVQPLLATYGLGPQNIQAVRMTRWGHSMPVAHPNLVASGVLEAAHQPIAGRIFFANQDNWASPAFETSFEEGATAASAVRQLLGVERRRARRS